MTHPQLRALPTFLCLLTLCVSQPVAALSYQVPPILDELASPFTEAEAGGIGCLVASATIGGIMTYMFGGIRPVMAALSTPMAPTRVLEGSAAAAFVFSSACYIGVALAPLAMVTYTSIVDQFAANTRPSPLFAPVGSEASPIPSTPTDKGTGLAP